MPSATPASLAMYVCPHLAAPLAGVVELSLTFVRDHQLQYEKNVLEETRNLDFEKLKRIKQLDLAQHEKYLMQKHNIAVRHASTPPLQSPPLA